MMIACTFGIINVHVLVYNGPTHLVFLDVNPRHRRLALDQIIDVKQILLTSAYIAKGFTNHLSILLGMNWF